MPQSRVVIVGAGPTGASLAYLLARQGIEVALLERETTFNRIFRGEGLMPSGIDALAQMGLRADVERLPQRKLDAWKYHMNGGHLFSIPEPTRETPNAVRVLSQPHLLRMLVSKAGEHANFRFVPGFQVRDIAREGRKIVGVTGNDEGGERQVPGDFVIGADGRGSIIRTRSRIDLDLSRQDSPRNYDVIWCSLPLPPWLEEETNWYGFAARETLATMYPSPLGELRVGWLVPRRKQRHFRERDMLEEVAKLVPAYVRDHILANKSQASPPVYFNVLFGYCHRWHKPGILLLGDAAHPMNPTRAQGINLGFRDAIVAANHLVPVLKRGRTMAELNAAAEMVQRERQPEIVKAQDLQLEISGPPAFFDWTWFRKTLLPFLSKIGLPQKAILRSERELRDGATSVQLAV